MRKVIEFDEDTYQALVQLGRDRMAALQELADESFADLLKKHGVPKDLREALRRSVKAAAPPKRKKKAARRK
jgi:non-homologous end joining protein Ku